MTCEEKDRHVLAAAVRANAEVIVTFNVSDFPPASTMPYDIAVLDPDAFLLDQLDLHPRRTMRSLERQSASYGHPPMELDEVLHALERTGVPAFVAAARAALSSG